MKYRATIKLYPEIYEASGYSEAEQLLEEYKDQIATLTGKLEFRDYYLSLEIEEAN